MSDAAVTHLPAPGTVTMFTTTWCGYCRRLKSQMEREGIPFTEIDIEREPGTAEFVMSVNDGNQTVAIINANASGCRVAQRMPSCVRRKRDRRADPTRFQHRWR